MVQDPSDQPVDQADQLASQQSTQVEPVEYPYCGNCGSDSVARDAWAVWNAADQACELQQVFDYAFCFDCEGETKLEWKALASDEDKTTIIRRLNDELRTGKSTDGKVVITAGVEARGPEFVLKAREAVAKFDDFTPDNDPHEERDFGSVEVQGERLFFKVESYDRKLEMHSPDAANPAVTTRVLTIMLASEY